MFKNLIVIMLGGGLGSIFRYINVIAVNKFIISPFPYGTFLVNIIGCFLIGLFVASSEKSTLFSLELKLFLITGFCGGYTTFSTFIMEFVNLLKTNQFYIGLAYVMSSVMAGLIAFSLGYKLIA